MKKLLFLTFATFLFISCSNDDDPQSEPNPPEAFEKGIFVTNEGPFGSGTGNVTFISEDYATVSQNIFKTVNGKDLGNIVQSMNFQDENAYIVINNSQKIEVVNRYSFESVDSIKTGINNPRYFIGTDANRGYVSNWGDPNDTTDDFISVVDLRNNDVSATIPVSFGPEKMVASGGKIYVAHQGGYGQNNLISVISGNTLESTIIVGDVPNSMVVSGNSLFVLCGGNPSYTGSETGGSLIKIDLSNGQISNTYNLALTQHPSGLTLDGSNLYYNLDGKVYKVNSTAVSLPGAEIANGFFYTLEAHNGKLYATDAGDYASAGSLKVFDLSTNQQIQEFQTGIIPGGIYFND